MEIDDLLAFLETLTDGFAPDVEIRERTVATSRNGDRD
jgi:hypothetical protein